jgi:Ca2+-binding RTX toxin-like protein
VDTGSWNACDSPTKYAWIADGTHTFRVRARDAAGNLDASPAARTWTMPPPNDNFARAQAITGTSGSLVAGSVGATMETGEPLHAGVGSRSIWYRWTAPSDGKLTLDTFGSEFPSVVALYTGSSVDSLTELASGNDWHSSGWGRAVANVSAGTTYSIAVGGDQVPNVGPGRGTAHLNWSLGAADTTPPDTSIAAGPSGSVTSRSASFSFSATEGGAAFECSLDGAAFAGCTSPRDYDGLSDGVHSFSVRARDEAGNVDPSPATRAWTVDATPPETMINSGPSGTTTSRSASFSFSTSESGASFGCSLDGDAFASCTSPISYDGLAVGSHTFAVRATDSVGNTDASPATQSWWVALPESPPADPATGDSPPLSSSPTAAGETPQQSPPAAPPDLTSPATPAGAGPRNVASPRVNGEARVGRTLVLDAGGWIGDGPIAVEYRWQRCDATGSRCRDIRASASRYTLTNADAGHRLRGRVVARNGVGGADAAVTSGVVRAARGVTRILGSSRADVIRGTPGPDVIVGGAGNDVLVGESGPDRVVGGPGRDRLVGGRGDDILVARDGEPDRLDGGSGTDRGSWDARDRRRLLEREIDAR